MSTSKLPTWILYYAGFLVLVGVSAGLIGYFAPEIMFSSVTADFNDIAPITGMFAARNVAMAVMLGLALYRRHPHSLALAFITRFVTELQDLFVLTSTGAMPMSPVVAIVIWLIIFLIPEGLAIQVLRNRIMLKRKEM